MRKIFLILLTLNFFTINSQELPDFSDISEVPSEEISEEDKPELSPFEYIRELQNRGTTMIDSRFKSLKDGFSAKGIILIILFSFLYGILHAAGPGHGKMIVFSYFLAEDRSPGDIRALSILIPLIHTTGAVILALLLKSVLTFVTGFSVLAIQYVFTMLSGFLIAGISIYLMLRDKKRVNIKSIESPSAVIRNLPVALSIGIVPCPLSLTVITTSIIYNMFWIGMVSVVSLGIAMSIVLYFIALIASKSHDKVFEDRSSRVTSILHTIGELLILIVGITFIINGGTALWPLIF